ncbi:class I SAM-dependent methyltransferase [Piscinibacter sp. Jin2]|uniref:Class I SAM-dependent methyltransferase n=1 Tax=Aquariibacter lacus TaxID=2801332 RepID=A0A9X0XC16_9BURK|nr:cyclopropane-fatty-acyl-phospholipid synthase family protein [Piscinibacter lacus]MBL0718749.1 class I SAM-dependent methyltransferase [Piscinibacter lacus]
MSSRHEPSATVPTFGALSALPAGAPAAARVVFGLLQKLQHGTLDVQLPDGSLLRFGEPHPSTQERHGALRLLDWSACSAALKSGDIGFAESYIDGRWTTPDLAALLKVFIANRDAIESVVYGSWWGALLYRIKHLLNRNTKAGSEKNIHAHYDLGNGFYSLWLDETMSYSSALFEGELDRPLPEAQRAKVRRALREVQAGPGCRVLEIGCGWGGLAEVAATEFGARLDGVTISREQLAWGQARMQAAGLAEQARLRYQDYREIDDGPFDAVVSIEMFEAVGREYWDSYFDTVQRQLKPGGLACIQTITIRDDLFDRYVKSTDFIQQYIFPGGLLPSISQFEAMAGKHGLLVERRLAFGPDYAETLKRWREAFLGQDGRVRRLGFDTRFMRIWEFYLAYCEAAFAMGNTNVVQFTLRKPG